MLTFDAMNCSRIDATYAARLRSSGIDGFHTSVAWGDRKGFRETVIALERIHAMLDRLGEDLTLALSVNDIRQAKANRRIAVVLGVQNTTPIEDDEALLWVLHRLGVRIVQLTYNERNLVGDGCTARHDAGLSAFGVRVVRKLNDLRLAVDVSHAGERTLLDAVSYSNAPVICSHANSRTVCDFPRNVSDTALRAIARTGGVVGITSIGHFVSRSSPTLETMLDHIDYVANLVGIDHVGVGSDLFEGRHADIQDLITAMATSYAIDPTRLWHPDWGADGQEHEGNDRFDPSCARRVAGLRKATDMPNLVAGLERRRYSARQIDQIMGENFLRALGEIWGA